MWKIDKASYVTHVCLVEFIWGEWENLNSNKLWYILFLVQIHSYIPCDRPGFGFESDLWPFTTCLSLSLFCPYHKRKAIKCTQNKLSEISVFNLMTFSTGLRDSAHFQRPAMSVTCCREKGCWRLLQPYPVNLWSFCLKISSEPSLWPLAVSCHLQNNLGAELGVILCSKLRATIVTSSHFQ